MKIYSNPNFPRTFTNAPQSSAPRRGQFDTAAFVAELSARNARALEQSRAVHREAQPAARSAEQAAPHVHQVAGRTRSNAAHNHRFCGTTGPPIAVPGGGHVHAFHGVTKIRHRENE